MEFEQGRCVALERRDQRMAQEKSLLIPGLPDELALLCIARVPFRWHLELSGVSRAWQILLHGRELLRVRHELSLTEECLFFWTEDGNTWSGYDSWITSSLGKLPLMPHDNRVVGSSGFASANGAIFVIGGFLEANSDGSSDGESSYVPSKVVSSLDVRSRRWKRVADLKYARAECMTAVLGDQIYVFGGLIDRDTITIEAEVYDPDTDRWRKISPMISPQITLPFAVMGEKIHARLWGSKSNGILSDPKGVAYNPKTDEWEYLNNGFDAKWLHKTAVLDGHLYGMGKSIKFATGKLAEGEYQEDLAEESLHRFNPSRSVWEMVKQDAERNVHPDSYRWGDFVSGGDDLVCDNFQLLTFCGQLCVVAIEEASHDPVLINTVELNVEESAEESTWYMAAVDSCCVSPETFAYIGEVWSCQLIAL